jgi:hypothetical protein
MSISELEKRVKSLEESVKKLQNINVSTSSKTYKKHKTQKTQKKTKSTKKKRQNPYFSAMLKAKQSGASSFTYGGKTYVRKEHPQLGYIYKQK